MPKRGSGFTRGEVECLLDAIEKYLPIGMNEWEKVENYVSDRFPSESSRRTKESLKRKFSSLYRTRIPTGDPNCPPEVKRAKRLLEDIKNRADLTEGEDEEEESVGEYGRDGNDELFASDEDNNNTSFQLADDDLGRNRSEDNGEVLEEPVVEDALNHSGNSSDRDLQEVRNMNNNNYDNSTPAPPRPPPLLRNASGKELATPITRKGTRTSKKGMTSGADKNGDLSFSDVMKYMMNKHDMEKEERMIERKERMEMEERRMQEEYRQRMELAQMQMQQQQKQQDQWMQMQMQYQQLMGMFMMSMSNTNAAQGRGGYLPPNSMNVLRNMPRQTSDNADAQSNDVNEQSSR